IERKIPGNRFELCRARRPIHGMPQPCRSVDDVQQSRSLWTKGPAVDRMIWIALDVDHIRFGILRFIAQRVNQDAASDRAIGAGVAGLFRANKLELAPGGGLRFAGSREAERPET